MGFSALRDGKARSVAHPQEENWCSSIYLQGYRCPQPQKEVSRAQNTEIQAEEGQTQLYLALAFTRGLILVKVCGGEGGGSRGEGNFHNQPGRKADTGKG